MYAININGEIKEYNNLPKSWGKVIGGFNLLSDEELADYGFYNVEISENYNESIHNLSDIYFDESNSVFKKDAIDKTWSQTLEELKEKQINNFKGQIGSKLAQTDWYIIRSVDNGVAIPSDITDERAALRTQCDTVETEINNLSTKAEVMSYNFPNID